MITAGTALIGTTTSPAAVSAAPRSLSKSLPGSSGAGDVPATVTVTVSRCPSLASAALDLPIPAHAIVMSAASASDTPRTTAASPRGALVRTISDPSGAEPPDAAIGLVTVATANGE